MAARSIPDPIVSQIKSHRAAWKSEKPDRVAKFWTSKGDMLTPLGFLRSGEEIQTAFANAFAEGPEAAAPIAGACPK